MFCKGTYILEARIVVLADVVQLVDEQMIFFFEEFERLTDSVASEFCVRGRPAI